MPLKELNSYRKALRINNDELAKRIGVSRSTVTQIMNGSKQNAGFEIVEKICGAIGVSILFLSESDMNQIFSFNSLSSDSLALAHHFDSLDDHGKRLIELVMREEMARVREASAPVIAPTRILPLYHTPAAAGYSSPAIRDDYDEIEVAADQNGDFAVKIRGESMEPLIPDGSTVFVDRNTRLKNGDIGLFFVDGDMLCKQYFLDDQRNLQLRSLNKKYADSDRIIPVDSGINVCCYGKVLI